ncbi:MULTISPECIES: hypothetical protein [unclassified Streptomyces]
MRPFPSTLPAFADRPGDVGLDSVRITRVRRGLPFRPGNALASREYDL